MATSARTAYERYDCGGNAVRELVMQHLPMVGFIVGRACASLPAGLSEDDLIAYEEVVSAGPRPAALARLAARRRA